MFIWSPETKTVSLFLDGRKPSLEDMQKAVGGYIELTRINGVKVYVKEDARWGANSLATWWPKRSGSDMLLGTILIDTKNQTKAEQLFNGVVVTPFDTKANPPPPFIVAFP